MWILSPLKNPNFKHYRCTVPSLSLYEKLFWYQYSVELGNFNIHIRYMRLLDAAIHVDLRDGMYYFAYDSIFRLLRMELINKYFVFFAIKNAMNISLVV